MQYNQAAVHASCCSSIWTAATSAATLLVARECWPHSTGTRHAVPLIQQHQPAQTICSSCSSTALMSFNRPYNTSVLLRSAGAAGSPLPCLVGRALSVRSLAWQECPLGLNLANPSATVSSSFVSSSTKHVVLSPCVNQPVVTGQTRLLVLSCT